MGNEALDKSRYHSTPREFYKFTFGENIYRYTSGYNSVSWNGEEWSPITIKRSKTVNATDAVSKTIEISVPLDNDVAQLFSIQSPSARVVFDMYRVNDLNETDESSYFNGIVLEVKFEDLLAKIIVGPYLALLKRTGPSRSYSINCPFSLGNRLCTVNLDDYKDDLIVDSIDSSKTIINFTTSYGQIVPGPDPEDYLGGFLKSPNDENRRVVEIDPDGDFVIIEFPFADLDPSDNVSLFQACDNTIETCSSRFRNAENFGGQPYTPTINPFNDLLTAFSHDPTID